MADLAISFSDCQSLVGRIWQRRHNLTSYDAAYVALAESLDVPLVTADRRLVNASGGAVMIFEIRH